MCRCTGIHIYIYILLEPEQKLSVHLIEILNLINYCTIDVKNKH